jgi:dipeptidyl aminopeptidase/acylaminoacyl peptidase
MSVTRGVREGRAAGACLIALVAAAASLSASASRAQPAYPGLEELVEVVDLSGVAASPDGRHVAFRIDRPEIGRNSYELVWQVLDLATGEVRRLGPGGGPIIADPGLLVAETPIWSADGRWIHYRALGANGVQIWRAATDGSGARPVTNEDGDVVSMERSPDGGAVVYRVDPPRAEIEGAELAEYDSGIFVDEHVELAQNPFRGAIINGRHASQRLTGRWFARGGLLWSRGTRGQRLDLGTLAISDVPDEPPAPSAGAEGPAPPDATSRSASGDVATASWDGVQSVLKVVRAGNAGATLTCAAEACRTERVVWIAWRPGHDHVLFAGTDNSQVQKLYLWDVHARRVRAIAAGDGLLNGGRNGSAPCAVTATQAICVAAAPASPPLLVLVDLETGARRAVFDPNPNLRARRWPRVERLEWRSAEGRTFTGTLFLPEDVPGATPLFINYYRCEGFLRGGVGDEWPFVSLAAAGIASACVNATRMSGPQDAVAQYRAALGGLEALVGLLASRGAIDRSRVGMGGLSFGSEVLMWAVIHSDLVSVASVASPQFEASSYWLNGVRGRDHHALLRQVWGLGAPEETPDQWRLLSPALNIDRIRVPLLMQLPEQESRYAIELYARLSNTAVPAELYVFPDEPHIKMQPRHRLAVYRRNLDWFRFWLQGHVDGDPEHADQYRRWRLLAERFRGVSPSRSGATAPARPDRTP